MGDEQRREIKRAILSELNKEIARKTGLELRAGPSTIHPASRRPARPRYDAQPFAGSSKPPTKPPSKQPSKSGGKKSVRIPEPTPRTEHPPPDQPSPYESVRPFAERWLHRVFGDERGDFRRAVRYRRLHSLRRHLSTWRSETQSKQDGWKLVVRADCHYRFYLRERYFDTWRRFVLTHQHSAQAKSRADEFCRGRLQVHYFALLRRAVAIRKERNAAAATAVAVYERGVCGRALGAWHRALADQMIYREQETIALHFWSLSIQRHYLAGWIQFTRERKLEKQIGEVVGNLYRGKVLQRALHSWRLYHQQRKNKAVDVRKAERLLKVKLQHKYFFLFQEQAAIAAKTRALQAEIGRISERVRLRRVLAGWRLYCEQRVHEREQLVLAEVHRRRSLLRSCLSSLRSYTSHQKTTEERKEEGTKFHRHQLLLSAFSLWSAKLEQVDEDKLRYRTLLARKHYQTKLAVRCFEQLAEYRAYRRDRKDCYQLAAEHYSAKITDTAFRGWHLFVAYRRTVNQRKVSALAYRADLLYHKYFFTWVKQFHVSRNFRQDERIAVLHLEGRRLGKLFGRWRDAARERAEERGGWEMAEKHHQDRLLRRGLERFQRYLRDRREKVANTEIARRHCEAKVVARVYWGWKCYVGERRNKNDKLRIAVDHRNAKLARLALSGWLEHHQILQTARESLVTVQRELDQNFLRKCLHQWRSEIRQQRKAHDLNWRAEEHHNDRLCGKVLRAWFGYVERRARDHVTKTVQVEEGQRVIGAVMSRALFQRWKVAAAERRRERIGMEVAAEHCQQRQMRAVLDRLRSNAELQYRKRALELKKGNFLLSHLVRHYFERWRESHANRIREVEQSETALWFWCVSLEHRVLRAWISYTQYRKDKARQYREAVADRRNYLLQTGVRQWMEHVTRAEQLRTRTALVAATERAHRANELAIKWGRHWLQTVRRRKCEGRTRIGKENRERIVLERNLLERNVLERKPDFSDPAKFYAGFKALKQARPAPKIPSFFVHSQYYNS